MKPTASLSLDLDNQWSYMKTHGDPGWQSHPSYLGRLAPRVVDFLSARRLTITIFVVGQDAALDKNREALGALAGAGHEIGNHSFHHEPWLRTYSDLEIEREIGSAEDAIAEATGKRPRGFRGPGYSLSEGTLRSIQQRGYLYDASTLPTFLGPLARAYYFATSRLEPEERERRRELFGGLRDGLRPIRPYLWKLAGGDLLEIPVTTLPGLRVPIHMSYVLYLATVSASAALAYFRMAVAACRVARVEPSILLHPLDFLDGEDVPELGFFPAMKLPREQKLAVVDAALTLLAKRFEIVSMEEHARRVLGAGARPLPRRTLDGS